MALFTRSALIALACVCGSLFVGFAIRHARLWPAPHELVPVDILPLSRRLGALRLRLSGAGLKSERPAPQPFEPSGEEHLALPHSFIPKKCQCYEIAFPVEVGRFQSGNKGQGVLSGLEQITLPTCKRSNLLHSARRSELPVVACRLQPRTSPLRRAGALAAPVAPLAEIGARVP